MMLMMLALMPILVLNAFKAVEYAAANDANADAKMPNDDACHLIAGAYAMLLMPPLPQLLKKLIFVMMQCLNVYKYSTCPLPF